MAYKVKNGNERAWKDANGNYVQMAYDEDNDVIRMIRVDEDGHLVTKQWVYNDSTGSYVPHTGYIEGGVPKVAVESSNATELLEEVRKQLLIMNLHLSKITGLQIRKEDVNFA